MDCQIDHTALKTPFCALCGAPRILIEPNADYITTMQCVNPQRAIVAWMVYSRGDESYQMKKCSEPLSQKGATALAESWAAALKLEVR